MRLPISLSMLRLSRYLSSSRFLLRRGRARTVRSQLEKSDDHFVFALSELLDRPTARFAHDAVDDGLLQLGRDVWSAKGLHHALQRIHQMLHEMLDPAGAAAQMPLQVLAHYSPANSGAIANGGINVLDTQHILLDQIQDLSIESRLQPVRYVPRKLLFQMNGLLADRCVETHRLLDRFGRCLGAAYHFHQCKAVL